MPRIARAQTGGLFTHVLNRGNGRDEVFHDEADYAAFVELLGEACLRTPMPVAACCLMPNHFHLVVRPRADGDLSRWMQWLMTAHVRRHHRRYGSSGHVWGGRFKSFVIQSRRPSASARGGGVVAGPSPVLQVVRYVERNPLRAGLVTSASAWRWSSLRWWRRPDEAPKFWRPSLAGRPADWVRLVNRPTTDAELASLRRCIARGRPFGAEAWIKRVATELDLLSTLRPRGRPTKNRAAKRPEK